jgi:PAS domain S-box-containing protein
MIRSPEPASHSHPTDDRTLLQQRITALEAELAESRRSESMLRRRDAELNAFIESSALALHWVDANGIIVWANPAELSLLGYDRGEYIGQHISNFYADPAVLEDIVSRLCRGETLRDYEARLRCKDGSLKTVLIDSSVYWDNGRFVHTQCFTRDVTGQRRVEQINRHMAAIVDGSDDAIISKTLEGTITSWNPGAERIFGYRREETIGKSITILIPQDRLSEEQMILDRIARGERIQHFETVRRRHDGVLIHVSLSISPIRDAAGVVVGASKIARDITDRKSAAEALQAARDSLARLNADLEERVRERTASLTDLLAQMETFSYTVSHDLRSPLRAIGQYARALQEDCATGLTDDGRYFVERIIRATDRMSRMINDVLAYTRVNGDRLQLHPILLDECINTILQDSSEFQPPKATITISPGAPVVLGSEPFLQQIFANLLGNAVKFVPPGRVPHVSVSFARQGEHVRVAITDNGIGIPPQYQGRLFGLFERINTDRRYDGTGMGLAIVRRAVERMGGSVGVESDGVNGSTFWLTLRATDEEPLPGSLGSGLSVAPFAN